MKFDNICPPFSQIVDFEGGRGGVGGCSIGDVTFFRAFGILCFLCCVVCILLAGIHATRIIKPISILVEGGRWGYVRNVTTERLGYHVRLKHVRELQYNIRVLCKLKERIAFLFSSPSLFEMPLRVITV